MIIELVLSVIFDVFSFLTSPIDIPELPQGAIDSINQFLQYLSLGAGVIQNYTHYQFLLLLLGIVVAIDIALSLYKLVMFVLKKIPFLNIQ